MFVSLRTLLVVRSLTVSVSRCVCVYVCMYQTAGYFSLCRAYSDIGRTPVLISLQWLQPAGIDCGITWRYCVSL